MKVASLVLIVLLTASFSYMTFGNYKPYREPPSEDGVEVSVYFCPDCLGPMLQEIEAAERADCALFELDNEIGQALNRTDYRIVVEKGQYKDLGMVIRNDTNPAYMHNKYCILDNSTVITGSTNPTWRGLHENHNNMLIIRSKVIAQSYAEEFGELWNGEGDSENTKFIIDGMVWYLMFCPKDACHDLLVQLISAAKRRVLFMAFSFTDKEVAAALLEAKGRGLQVRGVVEGRWAGASYSAVPLVNDTFSVLELKDKGFMHHKVFIVDDVVVTGSANPTWSGFYSNDENMIVINRSEVAEMYAHEFERLTK